MTNFVFAYRRGSERATTREEQEKTMAAWRAWFGTLDADLVELGSQFGAASTVQSDGGVVDGGAAGLAGYSVVRATDLAGAVALAKGCPMLADGGTVEVYETVTA